MATREERAKAQWNRLGTTAKIKYGRAARKAGAAKGFTSARHAAGMAAARTSGASSG